MWYRQCICSIETTLRHVKKIVANFKEHICSLVPHSEQVENMQLCQVHISELCGTLIKTKKFISYIEEVSKEHFNNTIMFLFILVLNWFKKRYCSIFGSKSPKLGGMLNKRLKSILKVIQLQKDQQWC